MMALHRCTRIPLHPDNTFDAPQYRMLLMLQQTSFRPCSSGVRDDILSDKRYPISVLYPSARPPHLRADNGVCSPYRTRRKAEKGKATRFGFARSSCVTNAGKYHLETRKGWISGRKPLRVDGSARSVLIRGRKKYLQLIGVMDSAIQ